MLDGMTIEQLSDDVQKQWSALPREDRHTMNTLALASRLDNTTSDKCLSEDLLSIDVKKIVPSGEIRYAALILWFPRLLLCKSKRQ